MKYNDIRRKTREVRVGDVTIGGTSRISVQSMTNTLATDIDATVKQIIALQNAGCDIVRITIPCIEALQSVYRAKEQGVRVPIVADIHFDYKLAIESANAGIDKIRINPGNIGADENVKRVCDVCNAKNIPIRIGINSGSLEKHILAKHGAPTPEALCESAMYHLGLLHKFDFHNAIISVKASDPYSMIKANKLVAERCDCPLHLGVTEAGGGSMGLIKSSIGIGSLLADGIGDTLRVSLTDDPVREVEAARNLFTALNVEGQNGLSIVSCPTCGRTQISLIDLVRDFERAVNEEGLRDVCVKVALMGCIVNGPGEAREADFGVAGGKGEALFFRHGEIVEKIPEDAIVKRLIEEVKKNR